jgi:oligopeptide/dipeptide ABC transporter ATP-binding protein
VTAYSILKLIEKPGKIADGRITLYPAGDESIEITALSERDDLLYRVRGGLVSMVFQEPMTSLSPVHTIGNQVSEAILLHQEVSRKRAVDMAADVLGKVGIPNARRKLSVYPHEISGGMRQRVMIAMALACNAQLLIADEPTTALDVTIQAAIMKLIKNMQSEIGISVLLITHDLAVVAQMADEVGVMYLGRIVEQAGVRALIKTPRHPYTMALLQSLPSLHDKRSSLQFIPGSVPSPLDMPSGCPFHPRCVYSQAGRCDVGSPPPSHEICEGHKVACIRAEEIQQK